MDQATLVGIDVIAMGSDVLGLLDDAGLKISVALWMTSSEFEDGRLVLSSAELDRMDLLTAYERVIVACRKSADSPMPPILILAMKDPFIRELRRLFSKAKNVGGMRLGSQTFGNRFIEQAYVFRIR
jgi:hypothetical protein